MKILYEDKWLLAAVKPQGMPTQPDKTGDADLLSALEAETGQPLGLLHRLDRPVGGVMLFAKEKAAEGFLAKEMQAGRLEKTYLTVLCGKLPAESGTLTDYLLKNGRTNLSAVVPAALKRAKKAVLHYTCLGERETPEGILTLAAIRLETGRHHQIRVQMAHAGCPVWGDRKYGQKYGQRVQGGQTCIALWSYHLEGRHPAKKARFSFAALPQEAPFSLFAEECAGLETLPFAFSEKV